MAGDNRWNPAELRLWTRLLGDVLAPLLGTFLIVVGTIKALELGVALLGLIFATALTLLGVPALMRTGQKDDRE